MQFEDVANNFALLSLVPVLNIVKAKEKNYTSTVALIEIIYHCCCYAPSKFPFPAPRYPLRLLVVPLLIITIFFITFDFANIPRNIIIFIIDTNMNIIVMRITNNTFITITFISPSPSPSQRGRGFLSFSSST